MSVGLSGHAMTVSLVGLAKTIASSGILGTLRADVYTAMEQMQSDGEGGLTGCVSTASNESKAHRPKLNHTSRT